MLGNLTNHKYKQESVKPVIQFYLFFTFCRRNSTTLSNIVVGDGMFLEIQICPYLISFAQIPPKPNQIYPNLGNFAQIESILIIKARADIVENSLLRTVRAFAGVIFNAKDVLNTASWTTTSHSSH